MKLISLFKPKIGKEIPFFILTSFLLTFITSRLITFLFPQLFLEVDGIHVHHYSYGIFFLSITGLLLLLQPRSIKTRLRLSLLYGFSLGLVFDEFFMWIELENNYGHRDILDVILTITLILLIVFYFDDFWTKWNHRLKKLFHFLFDPHSQ